MISPLISHDPAIVVTAAAGAFRRCLDRRDDLVGDFEHELQALLDIERD